jgi:RimK family alpha-L-glutamate ligase
MNTLFGKYLDKKPEPARLKIPSISDLLSEQDKPVVKSGVNIVILSVKDQERGEKDVDVKWTVTRIKAYAEAHKIPKYVAYMGSAYVTRKDGELRIHNVDDDEGFIIDPSKTVAMVRGGAQITASSTMTDLLAQLERYNIFCVNSLETIEACGDKYRTYLRLTDFGLPCPRSALIHSEEMIESALKKVGGNFPVVIKLLSGSKGVGVFVSDSHKSLISTLQVMWKLDPHAELLLQEYIESDFDIRVHVLSNTVIAVMKRYVIENDFRSNYSLGSTIESIDITEEQKELCIKAAKSVGAVWAGVDMIIGKADKKPYFIEVNSSPGTYGVEKAVKKDLVSVVMDYVCDTKNWVKVPQVCGFEELIEIDGVGSVVAKFDTGNGATCALQAENIKINDEKKTVSWSYNGTEFKDRPYNRKIKLIKGAIGGVEVKKVTVLLDVKFSGTNYKNVEFALDDRAGKTTPVLLSRKFMRTMNVVINPQHAFLRTINPYENKDVKEKIKILDKTDKNFEKSDIIGDDAVEER